MRIKCPSCGAQMSLDTVIDNDAAATALNLTLGMTPLGRLLVKYLGLFRPTVTQLTWPRVAKLLGELMPMIQSERVERNGKLYEAPQTVWCSAIEKVLQARDAGTLTLPMTSHGYLLEIIATEAKRTEARGLVVAEQGVTGGQSKPQSGTAKAIDALETRKRRT